jgi:hypothetical protein
MGSDFTVDIKDSNFSGIRSFTKGGVIYAGSESNKGLSIQITGNPAASISKFNITKSIFYDFIDLAAIEKKKIYWVEEVYYENDCCDCMKNYERYGYLFFVDQESGLVFSITNTIIDNFSNKSVDLDAKLSLNKHLIYPEDIYCGGIGLGTDLDQAKGGSIIYLRSSKLPISVNSRNNYYRGADLT